MILTVLMLKMYIKIEFFTNSENLSYFIYSRNKMILQSYYQTNYNNLLSLAPVCD